MAQHELHKGGEAWLAQGLSHVREEACPFCAAPLQGNQLVEAIRVISARPMQTTRWPSRLLESSSRLYFMTPVL
jgi:hypothetical protein